MKLLVKPQIRGIVKDSLSFFPNEYFCILNPDSALLLKTSGNKKLDCLLKLPGDSSSVQFLEAFFKKLVTLNEYYGQPVTIFLNNSAAFSYIKFLKEQKSSQVLESVKFLQNEDIAFFQAVRTDAKSPLFMGQGIDKAYLSTIETIGQTIKLSILEIVALPVHLILNLPAAHLINPGISFFQLEMNKCFYLLWDKLGNVVPGQIEISGDKQAVTNAIKHLKTEFFGNDIDISTYFYALDNTTMQPDTKSLHLTTILQSGANKSHKIRKFLFKPKTAATSRVTVTALNSTRLLISVLAIVCALSMAAAGISTLAAFGNDDITDEYQALYSNTMKLQSELDSLNQLNKNLIIQYPIKLRAAEILSSFCQKRYHGVYLTQLTISKTPSDSIRVEAKGVSKKESSIFTYHQHLNDEFRPIKLTMNSLKPEIQNTGETVDTFFVFYFGALVNEIRTNR